MKSEKRVKIGKSNRKKGADFERRVRLDLESLGWIVDKWSNNVKDGRLVAAKPKFNPFTKSIMMNSAGFPDFIAIRGNICTCDNYMIIGVESKINGILTKEEKEKCNYLLKNKIFNKILIAKKTKVKNQIVVVYNEYLSN